jgi:hypothetical protein
MSADVTAIVPNWCPAFKSLEKLHTIVYEVPGPIVDEGH